MVSAILVTPDTITYYYLTKHLSSSTLVNIYAIPLGLWPIFVPCLIEQILIMMLTVMKYVYDKEEARNIMLLKEEGPTLHSVESTPIKASEEDSDVEAANVSNSNNN